MILICLYMTTLVIHPKDRSTDFLTPIYDSLNEAKVVKGNKNMGQIINELEHHDRTLMMGHGCPSGLFSVGQFNTGVYVIGSWCVDILLKKENNVYIWCNADKFVERYKLKGLYSGMFISEVSEANFCGLRDVTQDMVDESNDFFAVLLGQYIDYAKEDIYILIKESYGKLAKSNPVAKYNWNRLYIA